MTNEQIVKKLESDIRSYEKKTKNHYSNLFMRALFSTGGVVYQILPYAMTSIVLFNSKLFEDSKPFYLDEVRTPMSHKVTQSSTGSYEDKYSYDIVYDTHLFEYSTGWKKLDNGLYERTVTCYIIDEDLDLTDCDEIFRMTKEELLKSFKILNVKTIRKNKLDEEDHHFDQDAIVIVDSFLSENDYLSSYESKSKNVFDSLFFIIISLLGGSLTSVVIKKITKNKIPTLLNQGKTKYRNLSAAEINEIKEIIAQKKSDLELLTTSQNSNEDDRRIRRR